MAKRGTTRIEREKERDRNAPSEPLRPAIDLKQIKARYSARPLPGAEASEGEAAEEGIQFVDAETLSPEELEQELEAQTEADIEGEETGFSEEALSLFEDETDRPRHKRKKKGKKKKRPTHAEEEDGLDFVDLSKPRAAPRQLEEGVLEKAVIFSAVVLMVGILLILYYWLLIERIEVKGNETLERADVLTAAGINVGEHILLVNTGEAQRKLLENPRIKSARISRVYPDQLVIALVERQPLAAIAGGGSYAIIDGEGYVLSISPDTQGLPEVYGMGSAGFQLGERLGDSEDFNSNILLSMIAALEKAGVLPNMAGLDITQPLSVSLTTLDGYAIHVGQTENLDEKLQNLSLVLAKVKALGYTGGVIDLAVQGDPVYTPPTIEPTTTDEPVTSDDPGNTQPGEPDPDGPADPGPSPSPPASPVQTPGQLPAGNGNNFSG
ncbi:MAG: FtsQ-type POTRA domain-containing protein [Candidatus Pelethousia sp.]|nr:FtsQ-type POTRA domain-containing protein [Candidatus Pelethousia sp.]